MAQGPRRRSPRPSFVVTSSVVTTLSAVVASSFVLAACGGQVGDDREIVTDAAPDAIYNPPPPDTHPPSRDTGAEIGEGIDTCPKMAPAEGTACVGTLYCDYSSCGTAGAAGSAYQCQSGKMVKMPGPSCNPPPPECPPTEPTVGTPCSGGSFGFCSYPDTCEHRPADARPTQYTCRGFWVLTSSVDPPYVATCPTTAPTNGSPCTCGTHFFGNCNYGDCGGTPTTEAKCDTTTGKWNVMISTCNPPAPDAGAGG